MKTPLSLIRNIFIKQKWPLLGMAALALASPGHAAYQYERSLLNITEGAYSADRLAVDGDLVVVPSVIENNAAGVVRVFRVSTGALVQVLQDPTPNYAENFGYGVAISGTRVAVASILNSAYQGVLYIFDLASSNPTVPVLTLTNPGGAAAYDLFGYGLALVGSQLVVGSPADLNFTGRAFLYDLSASNPTVPVGTFVNPTPQVREQFAWSVGLSGATVVLGAGKGNTALHAGTVHIYNLNSGTPFAPILTLENPNPDGTEGFGAAVAVQTPLVVVGATWQASNAGVVYVYNLNSLQPAQPTLTINNPQPTNQGFFGQSLGLDGAKLVVGAHGNASYSGRAYTFDLSSPTPGTATQTLANPNNSPFAFFGHSVGIGNGRIVVGCPYDGAGAPSAGAAYVFGPQVNLPPTAVPFAAAQARTNSITLFQGGASYDDHTPSTALQYAWSFLSIPAGSTATLMGANTQSPYFTLDQVGNYVAQLIVTDEEGLASAPAIVTCHSNRAPIVIPNVTPSLGILGQPASFDIGGTYDPDGETLTYNWTVISAPPGSTAALIGGSTATPYLVPDVAGEYVVMLEAMDILGPGELGYISFHAASATTVADQNLQWAQEQLSLLGSLSVRGEGNRKALLNAIRQAQSELRKGQFRNAVKTISDAIKRTDGFPLRGAMDLNGPSQDWILDANAQALMYRTLTQALNAVNVAGGF